MTLCPREQWPTSATRRSHGGWDLQHRWGRTPVPPLPGAQGAVETHGTLTSSQLMRALAPPPEPVQQRQYSLFAAFLLAVLGLLCLPLTLWLRDVSTTLANGINIFFFGTASLMFLVGLAESKTAHEDYLTAHRRWQQSMQRWVALCYCERCQYVFEPGGRSAPSRNISSLL